MCYERWMRRKTRPGERFDGELRHLLDEQRADPEPPQPVVAGTAIAVAPGHAAVGATPPIRTT